MLSKANPNVKKAARNCLGIGDVFLVTKESDDATVAKYKKLAELEKARGDSKAQEASELKERLALMPPSKGTELKTRASGELPTSPTLKSLQSRHSPSPNGIDDSLTVDVEPKAADTKSCFSRIRCLNPPTSEIKA